MDTSHASTLQNNSLSLRTRSPLSNRANIDIDIDIDTAASKSTNWEHKDSSEDAPSTHESICDAAWISTSDLAKSPFQTPGRPVTPFRSINIDLGSESPLSRLETPFLYGHGTELAPIVEQRSIATLRTEGSLSTSDLSSLLHDAPGAGVASSSSKRSYSESDNTTTAHASFSRHHSLPRRQGSSFSLDSSFLAPIIPAPLHVSKPEIKAVAGVAGAEPKLAESGPQLKRLVYSRPTVHIVDVHAYPRKPVYPPPQRPRTPPSLRRISRPQSEGGAYVPVSDSHSPFASAAGVGGTGGSGIAIAYEAPGFRSPRSGHGNLATHPFFTGQSTTTITAGNSPGRSSSAARQQLRGRRDVNEQQQQPHNLLLPTMRRGPHQTSAHHQNHPRCDISTSNPDIGHYAPPDAPGGACKKCQHPRGEHWSLGSTLIGYGPGARRGDNWCSRCACRKIVRGWCCGHLTHG